MSNREAHELLLIEEADAWFEYADATKDQHGDRYAEIEPWAWARLQQRLRVVRARRARLEPRERSRVAPLATLAVKAMPTSPAMQSFTRDARPLHARLRASPSKEILFATSLVPTPEGRRRSRRRSRPPLRLPHLNLRPPSRARPSAGRPDGQATPARKRRRGSRGGRGRKKKPGDAAAATVAETRPSAEADGSAERSEPAAEREAGPSASRREREQRRRRRGSRPAPRRAPLPKAKRELLVSVDPGEKRVAVLEDGVVAEVYLERPEHRSIAGNIYLGTVDNVLPGMEAAFVEIGLEKNGFLYVDEIVGPELEGRRGARKIQDLIQRGQTILVQAVKDPMKTKGARLTTEISLPGRFVVFVPHGDGLGVSRRLDDDERNRLKAIVKEIAPADRRRDRPHRGRGSLGRGRRARPRLPAAASGRRSRRARRRRRRPALIYQEAELPLRVTRDLFTGDFERLLVDHDRTYKRIVGYLKKTSPHMVERVTRYKEREPLLEAFGVEQEIRSTLNRRVDLPSGGYLIFDYAEAFTVIDVNTGRFVGSRSKRNGPGRLEDTITKNNLEAVKEVVRQLRLRDVGGIIVIDFIDMANPKNRQQVEDALRHELERDRTKTYVVEISPLGLVEMTRQNVTDGPREVMTRKCPTCDGDGIVVSEGTAAVEVERQLRALVTPGSRAKAFKVELNAKIAALLVGPGRLAAARARGGDEAAVLLRRPRRRPPRPPARARAGHGREARAVGAGRGRPASSS